MRLEDAQKWLDAQFVDAEPLPPAPPPAQRPAPQAPPPTPPAPEPTEAAEPPPSAVATVVASAEPAPVDAPADRERAPRPPAPDASDIAALAQDFEVPSLDRYLPFLRRRAAEEAPEDDAARPGGEEAQEAAGVASPAPEGAAPEAAEQAGAVQESAAEPRQDEGAAEAVGAALAEAEPDSGRDALPNEAAAATSPAEQAAPPAPAPPPAPRLGVSHRRSRHARNVRPADIVEELTPERFWSLAPRHLESLMAMGSDETPQRSYSRQFKETRLELIQRLLDPTLSLEETARLLNVCPTTVRRYTNRGLLTHQRTLGDKRRFKLSDVLAFLEAQSRARP